VVSSDTWHIKTLPIFRWYFFVVRYVHCSHLYGPILLKSSTFIIDNMQASLFKLDIPACNLSSLCTPGSHLFRWSLLWAMPDSETLTPSKFIKPCHSYEPLRITLPLSYNSTTKSIQRALPKICRPQHLLPKSLTEELKSLGRAKEHRSIDKLLSSILFAQSPL
jgi:hypothetical protein